MTSWVMHGGSFNEQDEDDAAVVEEIKAVDLELQKLQFQIHMDKQQQKHKADPSLSLVQSQR